VVKGILLHAGHIQTSSGEISGSIGQQHQSKFWTDGEGW